MNKRFFSIKICYESGEAEVNKSDHWDDYDALIKADILGDLCSDFKSLYADAALELKREM